METAYSLVNNIVALIANGNSVHIWVQNIKDHPLYDYILYHKNATGFLVGDEAKESFSRTGVAGIKFVGSRYPTSPSYYILVSSYINVTVEINEHEFGVALLSCINTWIEITIDGKQIRSNDKTILSDFVSKYS